MYHLRCRIVGAPGFERACCACGALGGGGAATSTVTSTRASPSTFTSTYTVTFAIWVRGGGHNGAALVLAAAAYVRRRSFVGGTGVLVLAAVALRTVAAAKGGISCVGSCRVTGAISGAVLVGGQLGGSHLEGKQQVRVVTLFHKPLDTVLVTVSPPCKEVMK